jgi:uncharacterized protein YecE (DUF72 family)
MQRNSIYIGVAGWSIPRKHVEQFPDNGTHLERYARRLPAVEINSSFYRAHLPQTYARWAASTPAGFRFAVKAPKEVTHTLRLRHAGPLDRFQAETGELGEKLGPWLVQLPPSLAFNLKVADSFFTSLRKLYAGLVACEPRHPSWFTPEAEQLLAAFQIARVAADPALNEQAAEPDGWPDLVYYRLHGSPQMYYSNYSEAYLQELIRKLLAASRQANQVWCIFDNTAQGAATANALWVLERLQPRA